MSHTVTHCNKYTQSSRVFSPRQNARKSRTQGGTKLCDEPVHQIPNVKCTGSELTGPPCRGDDKPCKQMSFPSEKSETE